MEKSTQYGNPMQAVQTSVQGTMKGAVDLSGVVQDLKDKMDGKTPQIILPIQEKSHPVSRQRDQLANAGYKSVLGGGYQSALGKPLDEFKIGSTSTKAKYLTPLRQILNTSVLDAKSLGFDHHMRPEDSPNGLKPSSPRKELKRKQLMAYHGWLKSKQKSQLSNYKKEQNQLGITAQLTEESKPESPPNQNPTTDVKLVKREVQFQLQSPQ